MSSFLHKAHAAAPETEMDRYLSRTDVWAVAFGCIIGWGAFVMPGTTFLPIAGPGGTVVAMAVSAAIMLVIGMNYAYLMVRRPGTGGVYTYTKEAFGRDHAFLCAWFLSLSYLTIVFLNATALFVVSRTLFGNALQRGFHYAVAGHEVYISEVMISVTALVVTGLLFIVHKPLLQRLQTVLAILLLLGALAITLICLPNIDPGSVFHFFGEERGISPSVILTIVLLSPWAFVGFDVISLETAHFRFPVRLSRGIIILSILMGGFVYAAMSIVSITSVPDGYPSWQEYIANLDALEGVAMVPTFFAAQSIMGRGGLLLMAVTALAAIFTGIIGAYRATTRVLSTMAEDRIISARFKSTAFCSLFIMGASAAISFLGRNALEWFVELTTFGAIVGFGYTSASAYRFAKAENNRRIVASSITGTVITAAFAIVQLIPKVTMLETMGAQSFFLLALWCLLGFVFYWRTMKESSLEDYSGVSTSSTVLFSLLLYSLLMWFGLELLASAHTEEESRSIVQNGFLLIILTFVGLLVMFYVQGLVRKHHDELEREKILAEEMSRAKSKFLFSMSHDIRTPMNAIIGFTALARQEGTSAEEKDYYLEKIDNSGQQLLGIINDVLDMSRIESGKMELFPVVMNLVEAMNVQHDVFAEQMKGKEIDFTVETEGVTDPWVLCDQNRFNRILLNLLSNSCKFTPEKGMVKATLRQLGRTDKTGIYELRVLDNGIGMSEEFAADMFRPFERERTSTVSGIQGTGLGLSITKSIVELMEGTIDVSSASGKGTEFVIGLTLPLAEAPEEAAAEAAPEKVDFESLRILLAEDNEINREIAGMLLTQFGCTVEHAVNGQEALDMVEGSEPGYYDLVLMDIQMPVMDGYEATKRIRGLPDRELAQIPIIAMTANAFREDEKAAGEAGMDAHIAKPLDVQKMLQTIAEVLGSREKQLRGNRR